MLSKHEIDPDIKSVSSSLDLNFFKTQITLMIFLTIIFVFFMYQTGFLKTLPCGKDILSIFARNFIHIDPLHLISNITGLVILYKLESGIGMLKFLTIFTIILCLNSVIEWVLYNYVAKDMKCTIGFSGLIFGMALFELINGASCKIAAFVGILAMITIPSIKQNNVSIIGHLTGVLAGAIVGLGYKMMMNGKK